MEQESSMDIAEISKKRQELEAQDFEASKQLKNIREQLKQVQRAEKKAIRAEANRKFEEKVNSVKEEYSFASDGVKEWVGIEKSFDGSLEISMFEGTSFIGSVNFSIKEAQKFRDYFSRIAS